MAEVLSREAMGLLISVLEVHTLVQAGCALIMYSLWFNKPLDFDEPTMVLCSDFEAESRPYACAKSVFWLAAPRESICSCPRYSSRYYTQTTCIGVGQVTTLQKLPPSSLIPSGMRSTRTDLQLDHLTYTMSSHTT